MGELTRKQHRVKRKLEERPQSLTQRDTDALDELLEAGNEKSRVEVLQASCSVAQGHPELFDEIRDTIADRLTKSELSALERHRAATLYGEVLISLLTDGETPSEKYITTLLDVNHSEAPLRVRRQVLSILGRVAASYPAAIPLQPIQDALIESIEGDHPYVAAVAAYALGHVSVQSDPKSGCDVLDTALYDHSPHLRAGAIRGLGVLAEAYPEFRSPQSLDILDYLGSDETEVRQAAISTLCLWAPAIDSELDTLEAAAVGKLESESVTPEQAITALEALGLTSSSLRASVVSTLESAFQDQTSDHGSPAGRAIGRIGRIDPSAVEDVIPSLRESLVPGLNGQSNDGGVSIIALLLGFRSESRRLAINSAPEIHSSLKAAAI